MTQNIASRLATMKNLGQIGLPGITGYIWYFKDNDIVKVNLNEEKRCFSKQ